MTPSGASPDKASSESGRVGKKFSGGNSGWFPKTHGKTRTKKYRTWSRIKQKCYNRKHPSYHRYGGRGIKCATHWRESFLAFDRELPDPPGPEYTLERLDVRRNYEPGNVVWATSKVQGNNKRNTVLYSWQGLVGTFMELTEAAGVDYFTARKRFRVLDWPLERALETPVRPWARTEGAAA